MRFSSFQVPVCLLALASYAAAEGTEEAKDVLKLTAETFEKSVSEKPLMLVEFFAPWCGHCKSLAPEYAKAATALKDKNIVLASVDCVDQADLCQKHGVQGYPTLKVYKDGTPSDYNGPRKEDGIISYMVKQSLPAVSEVTATNFEEFKTADKFVAIAYLPSTTSEPAAAFSAIAEKHRDDYLFGLVTDEEVTKAAGVKAPAVVVYRKFDEPQVEYPYPLSSAKEQDFGDWFSELSVPIIDEVGPENYGTYASSSKPLAYLFLDPTSEDKEAQIAAIKPIAAKYKSKMNFVWIDGVKFGDHGKALNLAEAKWPSFVVQDLQKQLKYPYDQSKEVTPEAVDDLVAKYLDGKLEPTLKSEPIPEQKDAAYTVVGKTFDEVLLDESKDVFVEFYATWCGHCKRLAPTWESLAEKYAPVKDKLTIAKMEATENDLPPSVDFRISGFPTLKFKPAGSKTFIDYEGDRSMESLVEFVEKNAKNSIELPKVETPKEDAQAPLTPEATPEATPEPKAEQHDEL